jgi:hypothetical protein
VCCTEVKSATGEGFIKVETIKHYFYMPVGDTVTIPKEL